MAYEAKNCLWVKFVDGPRDTFDLKVGQYKRASADYSLDLENWIPLQSGPYSAEYQTVTMHKGDTIYVKATPCSDPNTGGCVKFLSDEGDKDQFYISAGGSLAGLVTDGLSDFVDDDSPQAKTLNEIFNPAPFLKDISELKVGFKVIPDEGLQNAFCSVGVTELTPYFFQGTEKLGNSPFINCFRGSKLKVIHSNLFGSVTSFGYKCFANMFVDCKDLTTVGENVFPLEDNTDAGNAFNATFQGCTSLEKFSKTSWKLTNNVSGLGNSMFYGCSNLKEIGVNFTNWGSSGNRQNWSNGVAATGVFYCPETLPEERGKHAIPENWVIRHKNYTDCLAITALEDNCQIGLDGYKFLTPDTDPDDDSNWTDDTITINKNEVTLVKGTAAPYGKTFTATEQIAVRSGNVMSLIDDGEGLIRTVPDQSSYKGAFSKLFALSNFVEGHSKMLPATTLGAKCYKGMFKSSGISTIDVALPATEMKESCYEEMFAGCTDLTSLPEDLLCGTVMAPLCYASMFAATEITEIPEDFIKATSLATSCFAAMFMDCGSLVTIPKDLLPVTTLADGCYEDMFDNCISITSLPKNFLPATELKIGCYRRMFTNCTGLTVLPESLLSAETLTIDSCVSMFEGCSNLREITANFSSWFMIKGSDGTQDWLNGVADSGEFKVKNPDLPLERGASRIPTNWIVTALYSGPRAKILFLGKYSAGLHK